VAAVSPDGAVVEVGGVGIAVVCSPSTLASLRLGEEARLATSLVVREDSLTLYGFPDDDARGLFELLQTASGVGPRLAQAMLAVHSPDVIRKAISTGDTTTLTRVPGIGKKGAERLILELRDRVGSVSGHSAAAPLSLAVGGIAWQDQVRQALVGLGWSAAQAEQAVGVVAADLNGEPAPGVPLLLKRAIQVLGRVR
jgi:Holliday junction DNA helicase RuvA